MEAIKKYIARYGTIGTSLLIKELCDRVERGNITRCENITESLRRMADDLSVAFTEFSK